MVALKVLLPTWSSMLGWLAAEPVRLRMTPPAAPLITKLLAAPVNWI